MKLKFDRFIYIRQMVGKILLFLKNNYYKGDTLYFSPSINVGIQKKNVPLILKF